jgi:hypothetical protein
VLFGSNFVASSALVTGSAAAYFVYPPRFSIAIDNPEHVVELAFFLVLSATAKKPALPQAHVEVRRVMRRDMRRHGSPAKIRPQSCGIDRHF